VKIFHTLLLISLLFGCIDGDGPISPVSTTLAENNMPSNLSLVIKNKDSCKALGSDWEWYTTNWNFSYCIPNTLEMCLVYDGFWGTIGNNTDEICNIPLFDHGKECKDSSECMGLCIARLTVDDWTKMLIYKNESLEKEGACSEYPINLGPVPIVYRGYVHSLETHE